MTFLALSHATWICDVCGDERPDTAISVMRHAEVHDGRVIPGAAYNQKYCNDRPGCAVAAMTHGPYVVDAQGR